MADGEAEENEDSPDDSLRKSVSVPVASAASKVDHAPSNEHDCEAPVAEVGGSGKPSGRRAADGSGKGVRNAESAAEQQTSAPLVGVATSTAAPAERQGWRSKGKDREKPPHDLAAAAVPPPSSSSNSNRGSSRQAATGRNRRTNTNSSVSTSAATNASANTTSTTSTATTTPSEALVVGVGQITPATSSSTSAAIRVSPMSIVGSVVANSSTTPTSSPRKGRKEDGWKEVGRRYVVVFSVVAVVSSVVASVVAFFLLL